MKPKLLNSPRDLTLLENSRCSQESWRAYQNDGSQLAVQLHDEGVHLPGYNWKDTENAAGLTGVFPEAAKQVSILYVGQVAKQMRNFTRVARQVSTILSRQPGRGPGLAFNRERSAHENI